MGLSERTHTSDPRYGEREGLGKEKCSVVPMSQLGISYNVPPVTSVTKAAVAGD